MEKLITVFERIYAIDHIGLYLFIAVVFIYAMKKTNDLGKTSPFDMRGVNFQRVRRDAAAEEEEPMFNVNGAPMCGDVDIHGNPYGSTLYGDRSY